MNIISVMNISWDNISIWECQLFRATKNEVFWRRHILNFMRYIFFYNVYLTALPPYNIYSEVKWFLSNGTKCLGSACHCCLLPVPTELRILLSYVHHNQLWHIQFRTDTLHGISYISFILVENTRRFRMYSSFSCVYNWSIIIINLSQYCNNNWYVMVFNCIHLAIHCTISFDQCLDRDETNV